MKRSLTLVAALVFALMGAACSTASNADLGLAQRCTNESSGFSISYPAGWSTNDGSVIPACSAFGPNSIEIPVASEIPFDIPIVITEENVAWRQLSQTSQWDRVDSARPAQIAGRSATRIQSVATGEGLAPEGLRATRYVIDLGNGRSLVAATHAAEGANYDRNRRVLDAMVRSLSFQR